jgi:hypothetical protein
MFNMTHIRCANVCTYMYHILYDVMHTVCTVQYTLCISYVQTYTYTYCTSTAMYILRTWHFFFWQYNYKNIILLCTAYSACCMYIYIIAYVIIHIIDMHTLLHHIQYVRDMICCMYVYSICTAYSMYM